MPRLTNFQANYVWMPSQILHNDWTLLIYILLTAGLSEDSDYTSDVSYPIQQNPSFTSHHPNSSSSHFGGASNLSRRAIDVIDKEYNPNNFNSFSRDESLDYPNESNYECNKRANYITDSANQYKNVYNEEYEPLSYNSRPPRRALPQINNEYVYYTSVMDNLQVDRGYSSKFFSAGL